ncbi:hypothetical protein SAMN05444401_1426 [Clostridium amylolyticum]|uniref:Uncharacterized protein n=1 Tax=Clostridium amylolyticum TaxID=1121298 RepID=A0A1M6DDI6_9CLOT|nr:hypothetical protein [Clostridium amylolyticum]SHI71230.1 hypothetical protein SAMN05444401_1426 [Clostridium amylolyticum]
MNKKDHNIFQDLKDVDELEDIEILDDELNNTYEEDEEETPWELIEDIDGLSDLLEDEENLEEYFVEEFPGLYRLKKIEN